MQQYLEFNAETGNPIAVGPSKQKTSIEINDILADEIKSGSKRLEEYKVLYDEKLKKYVINEIGIGMLEEEINETPASHIIYQVPVVDQIKDGINIVQDTKNNKWKLVVQGDIVDTLNAISSNALWQMFYITNKDDPNILHNQFKVDLLQGKCDIENIDEGINELNISVFCKRIYNNYYNVKENA